MDGESGRLEIGDWRFWLHCKLSSIVLDRPRSSLTVRQGGDGRGPDCYLCHRQTELLLPACQLAESVSMIRGTSSWGRMSHYQVKSGRAIGWARVWPTVNRAARRILRRGAWYPILEDGGTDRVVIDVAGRETTVPRRLLNLRPLQPEPRWFAMVHRLSEEESAGEEHDDGLGSRYAVCPRCQTRRAILARPKTIKCPGCGLHSEVAWWETG